MSSLECIICLEGYNRREKRPCIGTCGHSICEQCKHRMTSSKCPQCQREEAFALTTINWQVLDLMKIDYGMARVPQRADEICSECGSHAKKLRICIPCAEKRNEFVDRPFEEALRVAICGDCALDGFHKDHRNHKLLSTLKQGIEGELTKLETRKLQKEMNANLIDFQNRCASDLEGLMDSFNAYVDEGFKLSPDELVTHVENLKITRSELENAMGPAEEIFNKIRKISERIHMQKKDVSRLKKAYIRTPIEIQPSGPILIADRKQSVTEVLLIGKFDPSTKKWTSIGKMPNKKSNYAVAFHQNKIYIAGGMYNGAWLDALEIYNKEKNLRRDGPKLRHGRTRTSAGFFNGKMFVCGGYDGSYMSSVEIYDPDEDKWSEGPPLNRCRADCFVISYTGDLFVIGGYNGKEYEDKIEKLNFESRKWEIVAEMQGSRAGFSACVFRKRIYIAGGWSNSSNTLKTVRSFDPMTNTWREEPSMNKDRKYFTMHSTEESLFAIRGCADNWSVIQEVEELKAHAGVHIESIETKRWKGFCSSEETGNRDKLARNDLSFLHLKFITFFLVAYLR
ncbi:unnamed protein product [Caenorhabditis auriculariae]|uniref:RING-type domain-containing protein n=1 Tax=Caenorhabditis auriculariae TaxID=2777116 RepID=A0A8S1HV35_9PELO|nr:unnamed protein product [Caenorhabditis auriculariae]